MYFKNCSRSNPEYQIDFQVTTTRMLILLSGYEYCRITLATRIGMLWAIFGHFKPLSDIIIKYNSADMWLLWLVHEWKSQCACSWYSTVPQEHYSQDLQPVSRWSQWNYSPPPSPPVDLWYGFSKQLYGQQCPQIYLPPNARKHTGTCLADTLHWKSSFILYLTWTLKQQRNKDTIWTGQWKELKTRAVTHG